MRIAILGTRGIPNNYGGFEQLAQHLSLGLQARGHEVFVYNSDKHAYQEAMWKGIHIVHRYDPEKTIGTAGQFIYDLNCILHSRQQNYDVVLNLGYTSSSVWLRLFSKRRRVITNMDGLEWKRSKYSRSVQRFLRYAEQLAVKHSSALVADSLAIQAYLQQKYKVASHFIAYGAEVFKTPDEKVLQAYNVKPFEYNLLIARMEPENNIEMILDGIVKSKSPFPFFVIGNTQNKFGAYLTEKYRQESRIVFMGAVYDTTIIDNLRHFCHLYFHGHSVGGTNPSLLEAMGCSALIAAHNNEFNKSVLGDDAFYFASAPDVAALADTVQRNPQVNAFIQHNLDKIQNSYSWDRIVSQYEQLMMQS